MSSTDIVQNNDTCTGIVAALCPTENEEDNVTHYQLILTLLSGIEIHERLRGVPNRLFYVVTARTLVIMVH